MASRPLSCHAFDFSGCHLPWIGAIRLGRASVDFKTSAILSHHSCLGLISLAMEQLYIAIVIIGRNSSPASPFSKNIRKPAVSPPRMLRIHRSLYIISPF